MTKHEFCCYNAPNFKHNILFQKIFTFTPVRREIKNSSRVRRDKKNLRTTELGKLILKFLVLTSA